MKRSAALIPLSHDHQHALDAALRLRRAEPETVVAAVEYFLAFFDREGRRHFEIEEAAVLPALPEDDPDWGRAAARVRTDHEAIRAGAAALAVPDPPVDEARALGERLHDHVRFEERTLFEMLERRLPEAELARLGERLAEAG